MNVIEVKDLHFGYEEAVEVLHGISFVLEQGAYISLLGPNGSGKSTLAKLLIGLLEKNSGSIKIMGQELTEKTVYSVRDNIGIVFQNPDNQFIGSSVRDDIAFGLENHCVPRDQMDDIINSFAHRVSMDQYLDAEPMNLSGGQKQRVAIAGVLAMKPKIMIFDESTSMLDPDGRREINALIREIHEQEHMTVISITHDIEEAANSDYIYVIDNGLIAMEGTPEKILMDEKGLKQHKLDIPFAVKLQKELNKRGVRVKPTLRIEDLAEELWPYNSVK